MSLFSVLNVTVQDFAEYPAIEIAEEGVTFLSGKSGTGKSTLLKLLNATLSPTTGEISYMGKPLKEYDTIKLRREVLLVAQNVFLFDDTIRSNFASFYQYREMPLPEDDRIRFYLKLCGADFSLDANCHELSGGERQRVFIAICLSFKPRVLLLDEPTSALDTQTSTMLMESLKHHCRERGIALLVITHDRTLAGQYGDAVISLDGEVDS